MGAGAIFNVTADRVKETSTTTGTGTYSLAGAVTGYRSFVDAGLSGGYTVQYCATDGSGWEVGLGVVTDASPDTLSRAEIIASSNAGSAVNWGAGTRTIFLCESQRDARMTGHIGTLGGVVGSTHRPEAGTLVVPVMGTFLQAQYGRITPRSTGAGASFAGEGLEPAPTLDPLATWAETRGSHGIYVGDSSSSVGAEGGIRSERDIYHKGARPLFVARFVITNTTNRIRFVVGLVNGATISTMVSADDAGVPWCGLQFRGGTDTNWQYVVHDGTTLTRFNSGQAVVADQVQHVAIDYRSNTDIRMWILNANGISSGVLQATSGGPNANEYGMMCAGEIVTGGGAGSGGFGLYFMQTGLRP